MAGDSVTFRLEGEIEMGKLSDALTRFSAVLDELPKAHGASVRWIVAGLEYGSAIATARAVPIDEPSAPFVPVIVSDFLSAAQSVSLGTFDPSRPVLRLIRDLTHLADESNRVILETEADEVVFAAPVVDDASAVQPRKTKSLGTVRGRVETLIHRGELRFTLFELATDRAVSCYLPDEHEDLMRDSWGHIADVTGTVTREGATGRPLTIRRVTRIDKIDEGDPLGYLQAEGAIGGSEPAEALIRRLRDAG